MNTEDLRVRTQGLRRSFGATRALRGLDLEVSGGEIVGLLGPDGAGKTTSIRLIAGLADPDGGQVRVCGLDPRTDAVRERLGLMPQRYSLYGDLSVGENLRFFRKMAGLSEAEAQPRISRLLALTRLAPFVDRPADKLSGGMYKKLALACALLHEPEVLLLDEPTNGVDPVSRRELWDLLTEFAERGMAILVTTPAMDEAERCHRVVLLADGECLASGRPVDLIAGLHHPVLQVSGGDRRTLARELANASLAVTPHGEGLRVLGALGSAETLQQIGWAHGATVTMVAPSFEDLFLARMAERGDHP